LVNSLSTQSSANLIRAGGNIRQAIRESKIAIKTLHLKEASPISSLVSRWVGYPNMAAACRRLAAQQAQVLALNCNEYPSCRPFPCHTI
jgi:hypothetical protein